MITSSPKTNPNLLQRSEIVALMNTLHRISESLHAVETFRRLYAETQKAEMKRLLAEEARIEEKVEVSLPCSLVQNNANDAFYPSPGTFSRQKDTETFTSETETAGSLGASLLLQRSQASFRIPDSATDDMQPVNRQMSAPDRTGTTQVDTIVARH